MEENKNRQIKQNKKMLSALPKSCTILQLSTSVAVAQL